jgi:anti-anti-sigma factor
MALITTKEKETFIIIHLEGDFVGGEETDKLREQLKEMSVKEKNILIIDLADTVYLATPTLGVLLSANAQFNKHGGKIILCNASEYLENIFSITKLTMIFPLYKTLEEAVNNL